jgi:chromosome segregation ATPase
LENTQNNLSHRHLNVDGDEDADADPRETYLLERQISLLTLKLLEAEKQTLDLQDELTAARDEMAALRETVERATQTTEDFEGQLVCCEPACPHAMELEQTKDEVKALRQCISSLRHALDAKELALQKLDAVMGGQNKKVRGITHTVADIAAFACTAT